MALLDQTDSFLWLLFNPLVKEKVKKENVAKHNDAKDFDQCTQNFILVHFGKYLPIK